MYKVVDVGPEGLPIYAIIEPGGTELPTRYARKSDAQSEVETLNHLLTNEEKG